MTGDADRLQKVVGMGSCGLDYLAQVAAFPQPDEKLRTEHLEVTPFRAMYALCDTACMQHCSARCAHLTSSTIYCPVQTQGGGNAGNALTAAARLGLAPLLISKIGDDGIGDNILSEFQRDGVGTDYIVRARGQPSPFTYIIVDRAGQPAVQCRGFQKMMP